MLKEKNILGTVAYMGGLPALLESFCWDWGNLIAYNSQYLCDSNNIIYYDKARVSTHAQARNELVENMQGDWLFMLDTDHTFEPDILERMLHVMNTYNLSILTGLYGRKHEDSAPVIYRFDRTNERFTPILTWPTGIPLIQIDSSGGGCLLVKREVFERIKKELRQDPFEIIPPFIEDHSFFLKIMKLNIPVFCAPNIEAKHIKLSTVDIRERFIPQSLIPPSVFFSRKDI